MISPRRFLAELLLLGALLSACDASSPHGAAGGELALVVGRVRAADGSDLKKVTVRAGERSVQTDARGNFELAIKPSEEQRVAVDSREFTGGQAILKLDKGSKASVELDVVQVRTFKIEDAEKGGRFEDEEGFAIELPEKALFRGDERVAKGEAELRYATVREPTRMRVPPELKDERGTALASQGLVEVRFYQDGEALKFDGAAKIEVPLRAQSELEAGERVALYHYDETARAFKREGEAAISEDRKWVATVDKFSWWTAAEPLAQLGCVNVELRAGDATAAGVLIRATGRHELWSSSALTGADGRACVQAPAGAALALGAYWAEGQNAWSHEETLSDLAGMCGADACTELGVQQFGAAADAGVPPDDAGEPAEGGAASDYFLYIANATPNGSSGFVTTLRVAPDGALSEAGPRTTGVGRPLGMTGSADSRFLYLPSTLGTISSLAIDRSTGALSALGEPVAAEQSTQLVELHPSGRYLYATNFSGASVSLFSIASDGSLASQGSTPTGGTAVDLVIDPEARFLFVSNRDSRTLSSFTIDDAGQLTALETSIPMGTGRPNNMVGTRDGRFLFVQLLADQTIAGFEVGPSGTLTPIDPPLSLAGVSNLELHPTLDVLYATSGGSEPALSAYTIGADGRLDALGASLPAGSSPGAILIDPGARFAYVLNTISDDISIFTLDAAGEPSAGPLFGGAALSNPRDGVFVPIAP